MFTNKTIAFLRALKKNNDRAWFHAHRAEYEQHVRGPMVEIVDHLAHDFRTLAPDLIADPKVSLFRPWRDTRFSEDKAPLKTNIAAGFPHRRLGRMNGAGALLRGGHDLGVDRRRRVRAGLAAAACHPRAHRRQPAAVPAGDWRAGLDQAGRAERGPDLARATRVAKGSPGG